MILTIKNKINTKQIITLHTGISVSLNVNECVVLECPIDKFIYYSILKNDSFEIKSQKYLIYKVEENKLKQTEISNKKKVDLNKESVKQSSVIKTTSITRKKKQGG